MSMIDLSDISGLPVAIDKEKCRLSASDTISYQQESTIAIKEISPILLNKFVKYPENVGTMYKNVYQKDHYSKFVNSDLNYNIYVIPFGLLGIEFNKSHVYFSDHEEAKYSSIVEVLHGEITIVIQKNRMNVDPFSNGTVVEKIEILRIRKGERIAIPSGVMYSFVNTGSEECAFAFVHSENTERIDYELLSREKGLAYFIISKNAKVEIVANPKYKIETPTRHKYLNELDEEGLSNYTSVIKTFQTCLYNVFVSNDSALAKHLV
jgi:oxalate decarboxylase/phosphoglucose isomerase-like protein (cupin superfamily)